MTDAPFSPKNRPALGQAVRFTAILRRRYKASASYLSIQASWTSKESSGSGMYAGIRYKQDGTVTTDYEDGNQWKRTNTTPCALVIVSEHKSPVYVPFDSLFPTE
jgi:hypothetical protein